MIDSNCAEGVVRGHLNSWEWDQLIEVLEDNLAAEHPVSEEKIEDSSPSHDTEGVLGHLIVKGGWELIEIGSQDSLKRVQVEISPGGNGEEDGTSKTVHHSDEGDIENTGVLEMDKIFGSTVDINILLHVGLFGDISVSSPLSIHLSEEPQFSEGNTEFDWWEDWVDNHSLGKFVTNSSIPKR